VSSKASSGPSNVLIVGMAILLFTSVLMGVSIHHLVRTGTCSSTGYAANYGPVPTCPAGTGWWIGFLMIGIFGGIIGGGMTAAGSGASISPIFFGIFGAIGFGALTVILDHHVSSGTKLFAALFGGSFAIVGTLSGIGMLKRAVNAMQGPHTHISGSPDPVPSVASAVVASPKIVTNAFKTLGPSRSSPSQSDPGSAALDQIEKLAELHKSGVLTDEEFAKEKAKLLRET
jgi:hypothetical protein